MSTVHRKMNTISQVFVFVLPFLNDNDVVECSAEDLTALKPHIDSYTDYIFNNYIDDRLLCPTHTWCLLINVNRLKGDSIQTTDKYSSESTHTTQKYSCDSIRYCRRKRTSIKKYIVVLKLVILFAISSTFNEKKKKKNR